jgi:hypothetical protein
MESKKLLKSENRGMALFAKSVPELLKSMKNYKAPEVAKWIDKKKT